MASVLILTATAAAADPARLREIRIEGLRRTREWVVLQALPVRVGEQIDESRLPQIVQELENLGQLRDISVKLQDAGEGLVDLIISVLDPWTFYGYPLPSYDSNTGFALCLELGDNNLLGYLDSASLSLGAGYDPRFGSFAADIRSYGLSVNYGRWKIPKLEKWSFFGNARGGMYSDKELGADGLIGYRNDVYSISTSIQAGYQLSPTVSLGCAIAFDVRRNANRVGSPLREPPKDHTKLGPTVTVGLGSMNRTDGGLVLSGVSARLSDTLQYDLSNRLLKNYRAVSATAAVVPVPRLNCLAKVAYWNAINDRNSLGGYGSVRGLSQGEIRTDNALLLNAETRFVLFPELLWGRWSVAAFLDMCYSFDSFDMAASRLYVGAGGGLRYRPNFLGGVLLKVDVAFNLRDTARLPEIAFMMSEMIP